MTPESAPTRPRVLIFFDYSCPLCYLDWPRFMKLRDEHDAELVLCPFELRPGLPSEGATLDEIGAGHSEHLTAHMYRIAEKWRLCFHDQDHVPNTHAALSLGEYARGRGFETHVRVHEAIWSAYFCQSLDIGERDVLAGIARDEGLDVGAFDSALERRAYDPRLRQFSRLASSLGVYATPAALVCNELFIGSRSYEALEASVARCMEKPSAEESGLVVETAGSRPAPERDGARV